MVALHGHQAGGHAHFFQTAAHGIGHLFGGMPHGVVDHHGALLGLLFGHLAVHVHDELHGLFAAVDQAVVGGDHVDVQALHDGQGLQHLGRVGQHDVVVVFLDGAHEVALIVLIGIAVAGGDVLAEGVVADKQLVFGDVGDHAVGPVQHAGLLEDDVALADVQLVAALDHFDGPVLAVEVALHGLVAQGGDEDLFGLHAGHHFGQAAGVVGFHVVADDVVDLFGIHDLGDTAQHVAGPAGIHGIHQDVLFVADQVGVVGGTFGGAGIAVEVTVVVVHATDPENIFFDFNGLHENSPLGDIVHGQDAAQGINEPALPQGGRAGGKGGRNRA